ncbi:MAG TPA: nitroreductase family protein [Candidatus Cloacimonadota bacterium]|nr:nitroreductase family protein [Candidatus Cloacimonadota bacterium]
MKPEIIPDYPLEQVITRRWSPRAFSERPLSETQALSLFEASRWAASCNNAQPWRFIWSLKDGSEKCSKLFDCLLPGNQGWAGSAPLICLNLVRTTFEDSGKPNAWAMHDLGLAMGNLTAQATMMDIYVHNMAGFSQDKAREYFDLSDDLIPVTMFVAGYLGDPSLLSEFNQKRELAPQARRPLSELFL